jgi:hypothetical protein
MPASFSDAANDTVVPFVLFHICKQVHAQGHTYREQWCFAKTSCRSMAKLCRKQLAHLPGCKFQVRQFLLQDGDCKTWASRHNINSDRHNDLGVRISGQSHKPQVETFFGTTRELNSKRCRAAHTTSPGTWAQHTSINGNLS